MNERLTRGEPALEKVSLKLRVGHLLRINNYLEMAILSMWNLPERAAIVMGMAEASVKGYGPGGERGPDEELISQLRHLIGEAREHYEANDFASAMARMRVAQDLVALHIIHLAGE
jgi:hypothetical protein